MTIEQTLTDQERLAGLSVEQLGQLVGLVHCDPSSDPFPITGWDALVWVVGNATQAGRLNLPPSQSENRCSQVIRWVRCA